ncbi:MlaE family lipid ABC transporter permease subunit [Thermodesulfobacteriota bacterium]
MKITHNPQPCKYEISKTIEGDITLYIRSGIDAFNAAPLIRELRLILQDHLPPSLTVDLEDATYMDDYGVLILSELREIMTEGKGHFSLINASDKVKELLTILDFDSLGVRAPFLTKRPPGIFIRMGDATFRLASDMRYLVSFIGSVCLSLIYVCFHPKSLRTEDTFLCMQRTGVDALPIVGLISFLLGLIMAFMSSIQLRQFGANIYVASLVSVAMTYELGPIMTAIIVAGRSGSSFASEIGTMKVSEEVDALFTMGFDPTRFLVVPKILSAVIMVPILTLFSDVFAILGGLVVGVFMLDLTSNAYINQTFKTLTLFDVFWGVMKSGIFASIIAWIGCLRGFQVKGTAASVGQATTSAVVSSIFLIIVIDAIFAVIHIYWF